MIVDAHFHSWRLARGDYGWLTPELGPIYRDVDVADWLAEARPHGVAGGVLVQAAPTEAETHHLLALADSHPQVLGVVGWVDLLAADAADRIGALARHPRLKGLRPMLQDIADTDWMLQPALAPALQAMAAHGLVLDALVQPRHLGALLSLAAAHPRLRIVIDHAAKPDIARGQWEPWAQDMARLGAQTQAVCKLSGLLTEAGPAPAAGAASRWGRHVLSVFGAERVLWGSDWPVLQRAASYARWWADTQVLLADQGDAARASVLGGNARRVYRL
ncbi:amidohydrolase family protein [Ramlibacter sp. 2FC]|uniref:amidohydrolase family protein n=1 Tax=Ramlibacter sp. 2FC TaxID=2502188 RepID=UPI0010F7B58E|nr:amidohydrolase family protein [Ramlibacter sp. 2FC]